MNVAIRPTRTNILGVRALYLRKQGKTWREIAQILGAARRDVYQYASRLAKRLDATVEGPRQHTGPAPTHPLSVLIHACGFTVSELARKIGHSREMLNHWIIGKLRPSADRVQTMARVLGVSEQEIVAALPRLEKTPPTVFGADLATRNAQIFALWQEGKPYAEIAQRFGLCEDYIGPIAKAHGRTLGMSEAALTRKRGGPVKTDDARAYALREEGLPWHEIGAEFNVSGPGACYAAKRYAHKNALPWPPE